MDVNVHGCRCVIIECVAKLGARKNLRFFSKGVGGLLNLEVSTHVVHVFTGVYYISRIVEYDILYDIVLYCMF